MELSPAQKHLIRWLKLMKYSEDEVVAIMLLLKTPKQQDKMMSWSSKNETATPSDIIGTALKVPNSTAETGWP